jgi:hypothetical protein
MSKLASENTIFGSYCPSNNGKQFVFKKKDQMALTKPQGT